MAPDDRAKLAGRKACPICGKPSTDASQPFCSERCRDVDLNRWLSGSYSIPAAESDEEDDHQGSAERRDDNKDQS